MRRVSFLLAAAFVLAFPTVALAGHGHHHGNVPPGNSGIGQYQETIPGAGGNHTSPSGGGGNSGAGGGGGSQSAIPPSTSQALASQGAAGTATANLANATAPSGVKGGGGVASAGNGGANGKGGASQNGGSAAGGSTSGSSSSAGSSSDSGSGLKGITDALTGSGTGSDSGSGMGLLLPIILIGTLILALVMLGLRFRRGTPAS